MSKDRATTCGLAGWRPPWLQTLASRQAYTAVYALLGIIQGMGFSYLSAVLSTIEKQFGIRSEETAWVFSGNEVSQICFIFALPFLSKIHRRPLWTGVAMLMAGGGLLLCAGPFLAKDKSVYDGGWQLAAGGEELCSEGDADSCSAGERVRDTSGMAVIFLGFFITGIGTSFFYSFGIPYIDDNVPKNASPAVLGLVLGSRTLGPGLGFMLGSASLQLYVAPGRAPGLTEGDDGWLGAWWLGFVVVGGLTALLSPLLPLFPRRLAGEGETEAGTEAAKEVKEEEPGTVREYVRHTLDCAARLAKNKIYVFNFLSTVSALIGFVGFGTFIPKFFEYHFRQEASRSGFASLGSSLGTGLGVILSGQVIARYRFSARTLAGWGVFIGTFGVISLAVISTIACPRLEVVDPGLPCPSACSCSEAEFRPTCSMDGTALFLSPCHAGCTASSLRTVGGEERTVYTGCSCVAPASNISLSPLEAAVAAPEEQLALAGHCPGNCDSKFYLIIGIFAVLSLLASTSRVGGTLVSLRAVQPRDKSASLVILISLLSLFAFFPSPIIYGAMLDGTCTVWGFSCGEQTNCLIYDTDRMRQYMCGLTAGCLALSTLFDVGVWYHVGGLQIWEEEPAVEGEQQESKV